MSGPGRPRDDVGDGLGVEQYYKEVVAWYRIDADQGNVPAVERLAELAGKSGERCRSLYY